MAYIRDCRVCGHPLEDQYRWNLEIALLWVEDCMRWRGEVLHGDHVHWCFDWDGLPVDETTREVSSCTCEWRDDGSEGTLLPA
jgi:hypothetical protein